MKKNDGGPAFPHEGNVVSEGEGKLNIRFPATGMSLRDYFAGQVIMGFMANSYIAEKFDHHNYEELSAGFAKHAYVIADAMIVERQRSK